MKRVTDYKAKRRVETRALGPALAAVDLEKMPVDKVLAQLAVDSERGLSSADAGSGLRPGCVRDG